MTGTIANSWEAFEQPHLTMQRLKKFPFQGGIIYGPVPSRHLGQALAINLLPTGHKLCSFNCLYCQYGGTKHVPFSPDARLEHLPSVDEVGAALENALEVLAREHKTIDYLTICGNGEPTLYAALADVVGAAKKLQEHYQPQARTAIFSNSSTLADPAVRATLDLIDFKIMKFDAGSEAMFQQLNHPAAPVYMGQIIAGLKHLKNCYLQSCFVQGKVTNADPDSIEIWIEKIREIHPLAVHICTLDTQPRDKRIERVGLTTLQWIANEVRWRAGIQAEVL